MRYLVTFAINCYICYWRHNFPHKHKDKALLVSPDHDTEIYHIDHIASAEGLENECKNKRGSDVTLDPHLVVAKLTLQLKKTLIRSKIWEV